MVRTPLALLMLFAVALQQPQPHRKPFTSSKACDNSVIMAIEGTYFQDPDGVARDIAPVLPGAQQPEALRKLGAIHQLLLEAYPQPLGQEAQWRRMLSQFQFAPGVTTSSLSYRAKFCYYICGRGEGSRQVNYNCDNATQVDIRVNDLGFVRSDMRALDATIGGRPVLMLYPVIGSWKGYELHAEHESVQTRHVVISRKGESPYTPVTRRQWLAHQQPRVGPNFDTLIDAVKRTPGLKPEAIADATNRLTKAKSAALLHFEQEFARSGAQNLLDSPAVILGDTLDAETPIFAPAGATRSQLLVTANPTYIKRDRPASAPQFIVMTWSWDKSETSLFGGIQGVRFRRMFEADFPVEKLQAMIDK